MYYRECQMKLSTWAKQNGISYQTAVRWIKIGTFPAPYTKTKTGTILVDEKPKEMIVQEKEIKQTKKVWLYARVSSHQQKSDMQRQIERLRDYAGYHGYHISGETCEIASGMNDKRNGLYKILSHKDCDILVEHRDRLSRFGFGTIEKLLNVYNRNIIVMNETEDNMDLIQDFIDVMTSMCARIYGKRGARNKAKRLIQSVEK